MIVVGVAVRNKKWSLKVFFKIRYIDSEGIGVFESGGRRREFWASSEEMFCFSKKKLENPGDLQKNDAKKKPEKKVKRA